VAHTTAVASSTCTNCKKHIFIRVIFEVDTINQHTLRSTNKRTLWSWKPHSILSCGKFGTRSVSGPQAKILSVLESTKSADTRSCNAIPKANMVTTRQMIYRKTNSLRTDLGDCARSCGCSGIPWDTPKGNVVTPSKNLGGCTVEKSFRGVWPTTQPRSQYMRWV
jgi:hypothetical protein